MINYKNKKINDMNNKNLTEKEIKNNINLTIFEKEEIRLELKNLNKRSSEYKVEKNYINWLKETPKKIKEWEKGIS